MKLPAFAVLLVAAGACAASEFNVDASNGRWVDVIVENALRRIMAYLDMRHPINVEDKDFDFALISREAEARGRLNRLDIEGFNEIKIDRMYHNILWGMLEFDVTIRGIRISLDGADLYVKIGDREGTGTASGILEINDIRVAGTVELKFDITGQAQIANISPELLVGGIRADWNIIGNGKDYSETVNNFLNIRILEIFKEHKYEINNLVGRMIKWCVEMWREHMN